MEEWKDERGERVRGVEKEGCGSIMSGDVWFEGGDLCQCQKILEGGGGNKKNM